MAVPLIVAETLLVSITVDRRVPVATPLALVGPLGWVSVLPLPVAESTTVAPLMGLPLASFAVTVIVELPLPAVIELGEATTVDCEAETGPGFTVTDAVWVMAVPFAVAETVFVPATVELSVPVATPPASFTVTVTVAVPVPAVIEVGEALTVDCAADTPPGVTVTVAVCVLAVPLAVADTVFASATVELRVPAATPLALVGPLAWVSVLPLPVAASTTVAPLMGFPLASLTVTVMVEFPLPAVSDVGAAATADSDGDTTGPEPGAPWQAVEPESVKVWPAMGT